MKIPELRIFNSKILNSSLLCFMVVIIICILYSRSYNVIYECSILTSDFVESTATLINRDSYIVSRFGFFFCHHLLGWGLKRSNIRLTGFKFYGSVVIFFQTQTFLSIITFILCVSRSVRGNVTFSNFHFTPPKSYHII